MAKTILVCDDEKHMLRLIEFNLKRTGHHIVSASSGMEVLDILSKDIPDLLIIDVMMPGMDGFETIRQIREHPAAQQIPIVVLTGRGQSNTREQAEALGIAAFLNKPFSPIHLKRTIEELLGNSQS